MKQPWQRLEGETSRAYDAFLVYLFMPPSERSLAAAKTRQVQGKHGANLSKKQFETWSGQYNWVQRVNAYEDHRAAELFLAEEDAVRSISAKKVQAQEAFLETERQLGIEILEKVKKMLNFPLAEQMVQQQHPDGQAHVTVVKPAGWNFGTVARLVRTYDLVARAALNLPAASAFDTQALAAQTVDQVLSAVKVAAPKEVYDAVLDELARQNLS